MLIKQPPEMSAMYCHNMKQRIRGNQRTELPVLSTSSDIRSHQRVRSAFVENYAPNRLLHHGATRPCFRRKVSLTKRLCCNMVPFILPALPHVFAVPCSRTSSCAPARGILISRNYSALWRRGDDTRGARPCWIFGGSAGPSFAPWLSHSSGGWDEVPVQYGELQSLTLTCILSLSPANPCVTCSAPILSKLASLFRM